MKLNQFTKCVPSTKIILFLLGEAPRQVLCRCVSLTSQGKPVGLRKRTWGSRSMRNLSTTAGMWRSCAVNSPLTSKPTCNPCLRKSSPSSKPTALYMCMCTCVFSLPHQSRKFSELQISDIPEHVSWFQWFCSILQQTTYHNAWHMVHL